MRRPRKKTLCVCEGGAETTVGLAVAFYTANLIKGMVSVESLNAYHTPSTTCNKSHT